MTIDLIPKCKRTDCINKAKTDNSKTYNNDYCSVACAKAHFLEIKRLNEEILNDALNRFLY
ncbi:MAG: hypothetical protein DRQ01_00840 [Ignavibacteriae bacterium]|nr:MAG: hypothetical protein DRQ01_00840 [Ignavibacteriota bacterium]